MTTINAQRQLQSTFRAGKQPDKIPGPRAGKGAAGSHIKQLHDAAVKRSDNLSMKKSSGGLSNKKEMTSDELVEYRLRGASEEDARQIAFQAHQQMDFLKDVKDRAEDALKNSAILFAEDEVDVNADPEESLKGKEWVETSRRKINGQIFRYTESCDERQEQLEDFCDWFELYENMWPLPLVSNHLQFDGLQGTATTATIDDMDDHVGEMEKMWPKMGMMREDLSKIMAQAAEMGRRALSAELKAAVENLQRKLNSSEEQCEFLQKSLDAEKTTTRELRNELAKTKTTAEVQMERKNKEIKDLNDMIEKTQEANRKQVEEMRAASAEREAKLKETIAKMKEATQAEIDGLKAEIGSLNNVVSTLEDKNAALKAEVAEKEEHIERLRKTVREMEGKLEIMKVKLDQAEENLRIEKEEAKKREAKYLKTIEEQKRIIKTKDEEIKKKDGIIAEKQARIEQLEQEVTELKMKIRQLEKELEKIKTQLEEAKAKISELEKRVTTLKNACEKLKKELKEKEEHIAELKAAAEQYEQRIKEQQAAIEKLEIELTTTKESLAQRIAEHEKDKVQWAEEKTAFEARVQELKDEEEALRREVQAKQDALEHLAAEKEKMMQEYEQTISQQKQSYEARIESELERQRQLEAEVGVLQEYKDAHESKVFHDAETEIDNTWFLENASSGKHKSKKSSRPSTTVESHGGEKGSGAGVEGTMNEEQAQRILAKFKMLREKLYFLRVGFEQDSTEFRSGIKESMGRKAEIQAELDVDVSYLRRKLDQMYEMASAERVSIAEIDSAAANRMVLDLCDESICLLEHVGTSTVESPSRLACELELQMEFTEVEGNEEHLKGVIATDIARACGGPVDKIKVRSLREGPVIADLILCQGLQPDEKSPLEIFHFLNAQVKNSDSLLHHGEVTCKTVELRLKKGYSKNEPRRANHMKLLQGVPRMLLDLELVLEGIEGALEDPVSLGNDPTMYYPEQDRPSSAVAAQLRPLLSVARSRFGADLAEIPLDFSHVNKLHNKFRKSTHETHDNFFGNDGAQSAEPVPPGSHLSAAKPALSPPTSPTAAQRKASWKVEVPMPSPMPKPAPVPSPLPPNPMFKIGSKREQVEQQKLVKHQSQKAQSSWRQQGLDPVAGADNQFDADERNQEFMRQRAAFLEQNARPKPSQNGYSVSRQSNTMAKGAYASSSMIDSTRGGFGRAQSAEMPNDVPRMDPVSFDAMAAKSAMRAGALYSRALEGHAPEDLLGLGNGSGLVESKSFESLKNLAVSSPMTSAALKSQAMATSSSSIQIKAPKTEVTPPGQMVGLAGSSLGQSFRQPPSPARTPLPPKPVQTREERNRELRRMREQEQALNAPADEKINQHPYADVDEFEYQTEMTSQNSGEAAQPVVRFRTASRWDLLEQHSKPRVATEQTSVAAKRPISKPITVSRRFDASVLADMSDQNHPEDARLPQVMEVYDMQVAGIVGQSSFSTRNRPATLDGADLMHHDTRIDGSEVPKFGLLPAFGEQHFSAGSMQASSSGRMNTFGQGGTTHGFGQGGGFRTKPKGFAPVKRAQPTTMKPSRDVRSPTGLQMGPWGSASENMERAFDPSASAPGYRPNKVIRSLDDSFKAKKPRAHTVNPRLNAVEVTMMRSSIDRVDHDDVEVMQLSGEFGADYEHDPLLQESSNQS